jgi:uncharacterized protein
MSIALAIFGWTLYGLAVCAGLVLDSVGLFGNWVILGATVLAWLFTGFGHFSLWGLLLMLALAVLGEVAEALASAFGAKRFGGGKGTGIAAVVGCLLGAVAGTGVFPVFGTMAGACLGSFTGAALYEHLHHDKEYGHAAWTGMGAAIGQLSGLVAKLLFGIAMLGVAFLTF